MRAFCEKHQRLGELSEIADLFDNAQKGAG
jgi:hypothetical protein